MDVMKPALLTIGKRCYRLNPSSETEETYNQFYESEEEDIYDDEVCDDDIEETQDGYKCSLRISNIFHKYLIGKKGETKKRLEAETRTQIRIPKQGELGDVVILGSDRKGVASAKNRINILVESARQKQPFTHFLSFPVNPPTITEKFMQFKDELCKTCSKERGFDSTIFQNPSKLHLTLGVLVLPTDEDIRGAEQVLQTCLQNVIEPILAEGPLTARVQNLEYMNDEPASVDVLYAQVHLDDNSNRLQELADGVVMHFVKAGLMYQEYEKVKLHITMMNTLMRKDPSGTSQPTVTRRQPSLRESFDATKIFQLYGTYDFGDLTIDSLHISSRYGTGADGYYLPAATVSLLNI